MRVFSNFIFPFAFLFFVVLFDATNKISVAQVAPTPANGTVAPKSAETRRVGSNVAPVPFRPGLMRINFALTSSEPTGWDGEIRLSRGSFADLVPLGVDPTCATSFFFADAAQTCVGLQTVAPLSFCGFEATLFSPRDARLELKLRDRSSGRMIEKTVFVDRLIDSSTRIPLEADGSGVFIVRAPADELPVRVEKIDASTNAARRGNSTVFQPNEAFRLSVVPRSSASRLVDDLTLTAFATTRDGREFWRETQDVPLAEIQRDDALVGDLTATPSSREFVLSAPETEGVFSITLELTPKASAAPRTTFSLATTTKRTELPIARRIVQGVVVSSRRREIATQADATSDAFDGDLRGELLETIDPTNPAWRKTFSKRSLLPVLRKTPETLDKNDERPNPFRLGAASSSDVAPGAPESFPVKRTFAEEAPTSSAASNATILGQAPTSAPFGNFFGLAPSKPNATTSTEEARRREILRQWSRNRFQTFYLPLELDRQFWGLNADLWEKALSSGNSRPFDAAELARFSSSQSGFVRLDPNGTAPRRDAASSASSANKIVPAGWFGAPADAAQKTPSADANFADVPNADDENGASNASAVSWEAFPVPIRELGKPHLLEIEYPANFPQTLGVAILEPSVSGGLFAPSVDVGLVVGDDPLADRANGGVLRYSVLFWPKTKTPTILLTNRSDKTAAAFGQIRVYRADDENGAAATPGRGRVFGAALATPALVDRFCAVRKASPFGVFGSEDWTTFDDATSRAVYYLRAANFDSLMLAVVSDGTALYPSELLAPTPRCDGGVFLPTGSDPVRKDVLELALAKFEANGARLVPLLNLNAPSPILEAKLRMIHAPDANAEERAALEGIEWIGPDGRLLIETRQSDSGTGPYYNILHPEVQQAVLNVVDELVSRCAPRESFGGLALDVGADGWLALPDDVYFGMDDATIARFVRESNLQTILQKKGDRGVQELLFAKGPERYRVRAEFVRDVCLKEWIRWRAEALCRFYRQVRATAAAARPDVRLYLVATKALDGPISRSLLYPTLGQTSKTKEALRRVGIDPDLFRADSTITLLRPQIVASTASLAKTAETDEFSTPETVALFAQNQAAPGTFFFHRAEKLPLPSFDAESPYRPTIVELETRALPADYENRRRFARQLAIEDALYFFDGGELAPSGQEETLRDWIDAFRRLPPVPFKTWSPNADAFYRTETPQSDENSAQPLVVRYYRNENETWVYLLNAAPFHVGVKLTAKRRADAQSEIFAGARRCDPTTAGESFVWSFTATPFDLVALRFADPKATIETVDVSRPVEICGANGRLPNAVQDFVDRVLVARLGVALELRNGDFEEPLAPPPQPSTAVAPETVKPKTIGLELPKMNLFKKSDVATADDAPTTPAPAAPLPNASEIPGWRAFGPEDVVVRLDSQTVCEGRAGLLLSSTRNAGGVVGQPFEPPTTGRLCAQICFGVPVDAQELPLRVCLTGRRDGAPYVRRLLVGPTILERARKQGPAQNGDQVVWVQDVLLFDRLPLDGLEDLSLRFDLLGPGTVWLDRVCLYKLAFADAEQNELMRLINTAEFRLSKNRVLDSIDLLDGYWARLLKEQIPDDSPLLASRPRRPETVATAPAETPVEKTPEPKGRFNRALEKIKFW